MAADYILQYDRLYILLILMATDCTHYWFEWLQVIHITHFYGCRLYILLQLVYITCFNGYILYKLLSLMATDVHITHFNDRRLFISLIQCSIVQGQKLCQDDDMHISATVTFIWIYGKITMSCIMQRKINKCTKTGQFSTVFYRKCELITCSIFSSPVM